MNIELWISLDRSAFWRSIVICFVFTVVLRMVFAAKWLRYHLRANQQKDGAPVASMFTAWAKDAKTRRARLRALAHAWMFT